jgi:uncharacterized protein YceK
VSRELVWSWYLPLLAGILPGLLLGFGYSALADRLAFAGWALLLAGLYTAALRTAIDGQWSESRRKIVLGLLQALGWAAFAGLAWRYHEILDLGFRAVLPALYRPATTAPATFLALAGLVLLGTLASSFLRHRRQV